MPVNHHFFVVFCYFFYFGEQQTDNKDSIDNIISHIKQTPQRLCLSTDAARRMWICLMEANVSQPTNIITPLLRCHQYDQGYLVLNQATGHAVSAAGVPFFLEVNES